MSFPIHIVAQTQKITNLNQRVLMRKMQITARLSQTPSAAHATEALPDHEKDQGNYTYRSLKPAPQPFSSLESQPNTQVHPHIHTHPTSYSYHDGQYSAKQSQPPDQEHQRYESPSPDQCARSTVQTHPAERHFHHSTLHQEGTETPPLTRCPPQNETTPQRSFLQYADAPH